MTTKGKTYARDHKIRRKRKSPSPHSRGNQGQKHNSRESKAAAAASECNRPRLQTSRGFEAPGHAKNVNPNWVTVPPGTVVGYEINFLTGVAKLIRAPKPKPFRASLWEGERSITRCWLCGKAGATRAVSVGCKTPGGKPCEPYFTQVHLGCWMDMDD